MKTTATILILICLHSVLYGQSCSTPGQTPSTAFPVCGTSVFHQTNVPICQSHALNVPGCSGDGASYADKNPFWYKFTCYAPGTLGFLITPSDLGDDYDWQLYDITGHNPDEVFTDPSLVVIGNWAGTYGKTGASSSGTTAIQCASDPAANKNSFSIMPSLKVGHTYLLLVSHYTDSQSGYDLSFGGGTAVITDPTLPHLLAAEAACGGDIIRVKINKHIKCNSIAADGSDFFIMPGNIPVTVSLGIGCTEGFDTDSMELHLATLLAPGNYSLVVKNGSDDNTLVDFCGNEVPVDEKADFTVFPRLPTPMDSMTISVCAPAQIRLIFRKAIICSSVAADGSDFIITGNPAVSISEAHGLCTGGADISKEIVINLSKPMQQKGSYTLVLRTGTDGNTILDECSSETPAGSSLAFQTHDTVNADFSYSIRYGCSTDTVHFTHPGNNDINVWKWDMDENLVSALQNPQANYKVFNGKNISLVVSNGYCADTSRQSLELDNFISADINVNDDLCPNESVLFTGKVTGNHIVSYNWTFGDGNSSVDPNPTHKYAPPSTSAVYPIDFTVTDNLGCKATSRKMVKVYSSCFIDVPNAFSPNNDGKNDFLYPLNAVKATHLDFRVYNRWGQLIFETHNWKKGWDGTLSGIPQAPGVYVWYLRYNEMDTGKLRENKGTVALIR